MEFNTLHEDITCNCIDDDCCENTSEMFALKTNKQQLRINDFKSHWEKNMRPEGDDKDSREKICSFKGKSISIINEENEGKLMRIFSELFQISPTYKPFLSIMKFKEKAGKVKFTPIDINPYHYDFYKCDTFDLNFVDSISTKPIQDVSDSEK